MSDTTPGQCKAYDMRRVNAEDAVQELMEWVQCADIDLLAELYSLHVATDSTDAVQIENDGDESNWFVRGRMMQMQLVPVS